MTKEKPHGDQLYNERKSVLGSFIRVVLEPCSLVHRIWAHVLGVRTEQTGITESSRAWKKPP